MLRSLTYLGKNEQNGVLGFYRSLRQLKNFNSFTVKTLHNIGGPVHHWSTIQQLHPHVRFSYHSCEQFEILVVRAPGTKKVAGQSKILMQLSDGQPYILMLQL